MTDPLHLPGFYGKLPMRGDFVARRLPAEFVRTWDLWLQQALVESQKQLGGHWVGIYLSSPLWRFALSPGICGKEAWIGVLMPSVDQAGRYFPLTAALPVSVAGKRLDALFLAAAQWLEEVEELLLTVLDDGADVDVFDRSLQALRPAFITSSADLSGGHVPGRENCAPAQLEQRLADAYRPGCTLWSSSGSELVRPSFFLLEGLPDSALLLLTGASYAADQPSSEVSGSPVNLVAGEPSESGREAAAADASGQWQSGALSDVGRVRKLNEDAFLERPDSGLWAVADGMGGHHAGDVASRTAVVALNELADSFFGIHKGLDDFVSEVVACLEETNHKLVEMARQLSPEAVIGSTVVVMLAVGEQCAAVWSGDSRLYRYRDGVLTQLTRDHSLVNEMVDSGRGRLEELEESRISNVVTQALGAEAELKSETVRFAAKKNDLYLLCSDGLTGEVSDAEIGRLLAQNEFNDIPRALVDAALQRRAGDNITVVAVRWA